MIRAFFKNIFIVFLITLPDIALSQLNAGFITSGTSGCSPVVISFTSTSTGNITSYFWDFGNGNTSTLQNPVISFTTPGKYTVKLTVSDGIDTSSKIETDHITVYDKPIADFMVNKTSGCAALHLKFTDNSQSGTGNITNWIWDFGDGNVSTTQNPVHIYTGGGSYSVVLIVSDSNHCQAQITKKDLISVYRPVPEFGSDIRFSCNPPLKVSFYDSSVSGSNLNFLWDFGDGDTSTLKNPSHTFSSFGSFDVTLTITDQNGCDSQISKKSYVTIDTISANFTHNIMDSCLPSLVNFQNTTFPTTSNIKFTWDFGDGNTSNQTDPQHLYINPGTYTVTLIASSPKCRDTIVKTNLIYIAPAPFADFTADTVKFCKTPATVNFTSNSFFGNSYLWDFGDGTTSTQKNPQHTYSSMDTFDVKLVVTSAAGCKDSIIKDNFIIIEKPGFEVIAAPEKGCQPLTVNFGINDTSQIKLTSWQWDFKNGDTSSNQNPMTTFQDTGTYFIEVTGSNSRGCKITVIDTIWVGAPPVANFIADKYFGCRDSMSVAFDNLTNDTFPKADEWFWDFGDGSTAFQEDMGHIFIDTGIFDITMIAFYNGCPDTMIRPMYIHILGPIAGVEDSTVVCSMDSVQISDNSLGAMKWKWYFGDGDSSELPEPTHLYPGYGTYSLIQMVYDTITGCGSTDSGLVIVANPSNVDFTSNKTGGCSPLTIKFMEQAPSAIKWIWNFGNNSSSDKRNPETTYNKGGKFDVSLTIIDSIGCINTLTKKEYIKISDLQPDFSINPAKGCIPLSVQINDQSTTSFPLVNWQYFMGNGELQSTANSSLNYTYTKLPYSSSQKLGLIITMIATDSLGCSASKSKNVKPSKPKPVFIDTVIHFCGYDSIHFSTFVHDSIAYSPHSLLWDLGNGDTTSATNFSRIFKGDTTIQVKLKITDFQGCSDSIVKSYRINTLLPEASFETDPFHTSCPPLVVRFNNTSKAGGYPIISYDWDFGDSSGSDIKNPGKTYTEPGNYDVSLTIVNALGCISKIIKKDLIRLNGPVGTFSFNPKEACAPAHVSFSVNSPNAVSFTWYFGDGSTANGPVQSHEYQSSGNYHPILLLTDSAGCETSISSKDSIIVNNKPDIDFSSNSTFICLNNSFEFINLTTHDKNINSWLWLFGDGMQSGLKDPTHTYADTGNYHITLIAIDEKGCKDSLTKHDFLVYQDTTLPSKSELWRVSVENNTSILYEFDMCHDTDFYAYYFYREDDFGVFQVFDSSLNQYSNLYFDTQVTPLNKSYCYKIGVRDQCGNISISDTTHCSVELKVDAMQQGMQLNWNKYQGWQEIEEYVIYRDDPGMPFSWNRIGQVGADTNFFLDTNVKCLQSYYYLIQAFEKNGKKQFSSSDSSGAIANYSPVPEPVKLIRVSVEDSSSVIIDWEPADFTNDHSYLLYRSMDDQNYKLVNEISKSSTSYLDQPLQPDKTSYYYHIRLKDLECNNIGQASNLGRTILLESDRNGTGNSVLNWNDYAYWEEGVDPYVIEYLSENSGQYQTIGTTTFNLTEFIHEHADDGQSLHCYRITAFNKANQNVISKSNVSCLPSEIKVFVPDIFTPNGDNLNDLFEIKGIGFSDFNIKIYNRWGQEIFESSDPGNMWDGTYKNENCPLGVYYYQVRVENNHGDGDLLTGNVHLVR